MAVVTSKGPASDERGSDARTSRDGGGDSRPRKALTIGAVAKILGQEFDDISISKIRYLEDQKLLAPRRLAATAGRPTTRPTSRSFAPPPSCPGSVSVAATCGSSRPRPIARPRCSSSC